MGTVTVSDVIDSGGVYGTIPSSIDSSTLANGDVVTTFKPTGVQTMHFRKEAGKWTVCAAAEDQM